MKRCADRRLVAAGATGGLLVAFVLLPVGSDPTTPHVRQVTEMINPKLAAAPTSGCQIDPVNVGYTAAPQSGGLFVVTRATVTGLDSTCDGATLTVVLQNSSGASISGDTGSTMVTGPTAMVDITPPPPAAQVANVSLLLTSQTVTGSFEVASGQTYSCTNLTIIGNVTVDAGATFNGLYCTVSGNVSSAGSVSLADTTVTGSLQSTAGSVKLISGSVVGGNLTATSGGPVNVRASTVNGNVTLQNLTSTAVGTVCSTSVKGALTLQNDAESLQLGGSDACPGNTVSKNLTVQSNTGRLTIGAGNATSSGDAPDGNSASGNINVQSNSVGNSSTMGGNWAGGNCTLGSDSPPIVVSGSNVAVHTDNCQVSG